MARLEAIQETHPGKMRLHRDCLTLKFGNDLPEKYVDVSLRFDDMMKESKQGEKAFLKLRQKYLPYD